MILEAPFMVMNVSHNFCRDLPWHILLWSNIDSSLLTSQDVKVHHLEMDIDSINRESIYNLNA